MLGRDEGKPVPDAKNISVRVPRSWEGTPPGGEVCIGEVMEVATVACSEARTTFTALTTADKNARF